MARAMKNVTNTIKTNYRIELTRNDIRDLFVKFPGKIPPAEARIFVHVPGGGDWSNMALDVDDDCPLIVEWTETEEGIQ